MKRRDLWGVFVLAVAFADALCDAQFGHTSWMRTNHFLGHDIWHWAKWFRFYGPLALVLWCLWPVWGRGIRWANVARVAILGILGYVIWDAGAAVGGYPEW